MKILVLGAGGMAGHVVSLYLRENGFTVDTLSAKNALDERTHLIDVMDHKMFKAFLDAHHYDVVVNCIGLLVKPSEEHKDTAIYLNAYLPHFLEAYYQDSKTKVIHIGSDAVFSSKNPPYREDAACDGESFYGRTKALGEIQNAKDLTFRMSIVGPDMNRDGKSLFNWFYAQKGEIFGYTNVLWNGVTTIELAKGVKAAIEQDLTGIYHLIANDSISKFALLQLFKEVFKRSGTTVTASEGIATGAALVNTRTGFKHQVPDYKTMIKDMKAWMENHPKLYSHYGK
ncbi:MAG TPA: sugar nucleotide-binding protein [Candidatus Saccharimonadales bacterium]|jgi:dTDP-4-dehydrorhamnose reductase|nr:sugar nucleotide-binding protein [Candidatus Saccharimonadales bacterium]